MKKILFILYKNKFLSNIFTKLKNRVYLSGKKSNM